MLKIHFVGIEEYKRDVKRGSGRAGKRAWLL